ncbi:ribonuclease H-like domain-containing protein [Amylocarpus encephaloides]|uniref:Ribonuclease H-like domain-containing protein n=1 Tax=Amylocarpus encephaloides TaxID=45428 RepID=A0A9P7Y7Y1_9HELO|nr:ribonuclease H-like domain-containing protein [Amylocarpus encephaloides]
MSTCVPTSTVIPAASTQTPIPSISNPALIYSVAELEAFLSTIPPSSTLYLDLEGNNICRHGTISIITILIHPQRIVRLIDVLVLGDSAFTIASNSGTTLKSLFEDPEIPKCLWDVRNDADALWALYQVGLAGVTDIQLLENASRCGDKKYLRGLAKSIQCDLDLGFAVSQRWYRTKKDIGRLMDANVFATRPMDDKTIEYCANDVLHLPELHVIFLERIEDDWLAKAKKESECRLARAHSPRYWPSSPWKARGPWGSGYSKY